MTPSASPSLKAAPSSPSPPTEQTEALSAPPTLEGDLLTALGVYLDAMATAWTAAGRLLTVDPHAAGLAVAVLLNACLLGVLPVLLFVLLGGLPLLVALRPGGASPTARRLMTANALRTVEAGCQWAVQQPFPVLAVAFPVGAIYGAWALSPILRNSRTILPWDTLLPPWLGLTCGLVAAVLWRARDRLAAGKWSVAYAVVLFVLATSRSPTTMLLPVLAAAVVIHVAAVATEQEEQRMLLAVMAAALYGVYLYQADLAPVVWQALRVPLQWIGGLRANALDTLRRLLLRALSELPGAGLLVLGSVCGREGLRAPDDPRRRAAWWASAAALCSGALVAWDILAPPEWLVDLTEALAAVVLGLHQSVLDSMAWSQRLPRLLLSILVDFLRFTVTLPLQLLRALLRLPGQILWLLTAGVVELLRVVFHYPLAILWYLTAWVRLLIAENFWVLEYLLKRLANSIGMVGDILSGEAKSPTITG